MFEAPVRRVEPTGEEHDIGRGGRLEPEGDARTKSKPARSVIPRARTWTDLA